MVHIILLHRLFKDSLLYYYTIITYYFGVFMIAAQFALIWSPGHIYVLITNVITRMC